MGMGHPRGCTCETHTKQREYARELRERRANGEIVNKERGPQGKFTGIKSGPMERRAGSRLVLGDGTDAINHWMPKEGESWNCQVCDAWFMKVDGEWKTMLVPLAS